MKEAEIKVFIDGIRNYFSMVSDEELVIGTPFLADPREAPACDLTGIIGISGDRKGCVYFTAPKILLHHILLTIGERNIDNDMIGDAVGEVANTISGNARSEFGEGFQISVPVVISGRPDHISLPKDIKAFIVPFQWQSYPAHLVVCLK